MATKTWIYAGATGANWGTAANWSPAAVPLAADDVIFNNTYNGNCTISVNATCKSLVMTGYTGTLSGTTFTLAINGADGSFQSLVFSPGMTLTYNGTITFAGTSVTGNIYTSGKIIQGNVTFSGSGSNWYTYDDFITLSTSTLTLTQGNLQPYYGFSVGLFVSTGSLVRSSTGNGQTFSITGIGTIWNVTGTNCSLSNFLSYEFNDATSSSKTITQTLAVASIPQNAMYITGSGTGSYTITGNLFYFSILNTGGASVSFGVSNFYYLLFTDSYPGPGVVNSNVNLNSAANAVTFNTDGGSLTLSTAMTITASPPITISHPGISNHVFFTFNGKTLTGNITINQAGTPSFGLIVNDTFYLSGTLTLTAGYFYPQTSFIGNVSVTGTAARTFGNGYDLYLTGSGTLITATTTTNLGWGIASIYVWGGQVASRTLTFNTVVYPGSGYCELGGTGAGAITLAVATTGDPRVYVTNTGGATVSFTTGNMAELIFSGETNVVLNNAAGNTLTIDGDLTFVSTMATPIATPSFAFKGLGYALANNSRITLAGKSLVTGTVTLNDTLSSSGALTGTFTFVDVFTTNATVTITSCGSTNFNANSTINASQLILTAGTLNFGSYTHNIFVFSSSTSSARTINFGTSTVNITGSGQTIWNTGTTTGLTISGTNPTINLTYSGSAATRTISSGLIAEANAINVNVTNGSDTVAISTANYKTVNFTGFSGIISLSSASFYGDLTLSATATSVSGGLLTFLGTSVTQTITSNGLTITLGTGIIINSATTTVQNSGTLTITGTLTVTSGTLSVNANLSIGSSSAFTLTAGTINVNNGANITCGSFASSVANTRTINMGWGTWTLTGTGTIWNVLATSLTFNAQQSRIVMTNTSVTACTFAGGGLTYYTVELAKGSSTAATTISGNNTFANFIDNTSTAAHTITFASSSTQSFYKFNVRGSAGNLITMNRPAAPTPILAKIGKGIVCYCDYITLGVLTPSPATNTWYIGANSSIGSSTGFIATAAPSSQSLLGAGGVG
jgi:hypothetical protein